MNFSFTYKKKKHTVQAKPCKSLLSKIMGKMFSFSKTPLLFIYKKEQNVDIHMLFCFQPLIVLWLNKNKKVIKAKKMLPFISYVSAKAKYVLEIPVLK